MLVAGGIQSHWQGSVMEQADDDAPHILGTADSRVKYAHYGSRGPVVKNYSFLYFFFFFFFFLQGAAR